MSYLPCENPDCKSYGQPHPNCRCHGEMAEGGDASPFCSQKRPHQKGCDLFAEGGEASPDFIPDEGNAPAAVGGGQPAQETDPDFIPDEETAPAAPGGGEPAIQEEDPDFIPDDEATGVMDKVGGAIKSAFKDKLANEPAPGEKWTTPENVSDMSKQYEEAFGVGSMITGGGVAKVAEGAAEKIVGEAALKSGSTWIKTAIANGLIQSTDEVDKWILGQGDQNEAVGAKFARVGFATGIGALFGKLGEVAPNKLAQIAESKTGQKLEYFLYGLANAAKQGGREVPEALSGAASAGYKAGHKFFDKISGKLLPATLGATAEGYEGYKEDGILGGVKGAAMGTIHGLVASKLSGVASKAVQKYAAPTILRVLANGNLTGITGAMDHVAEMAAGSKLVNSSVESLVRTGSLGAAKMFDTYGDEKKRQKVIDWLENGGTNAEIRDEMGKQSEAPQPFAEGGKVEAKAKTIG
jgi:hypothetical protein